MTLEEAATVQAWAAAIQAAGAIVALGVAVGVPIYQQRRATATRVDVTPSVGWLLRGGLLSTSRREDYSLYVKQHGPASIAIEIVNRSAHSVTISEVGLHKNRHRSSIRFNAIDLAIPIGQDTARRREPRTAITYVIPTIPEGYRVTEGERAYVQLQTGQVFMGSSMAFRTWCSRAHVPSVPAS